MQEKVEWIIRCRPWSYAGICLVWKAKRCFGWDRCVIGVGSEGRVFVVICLRGLKRLWRRCLDLMVRGVLVVFVLFIVNFANGVKLSIVYLLQFSFLFIQSIFFLCRLHLFLIWVCFCSNQWLLSMFAIIFAMFPFALVILRSVFFILKLLSFITLTYFPIISIFLLVIQSDLFPF